MGGCESAEAGPVEAVPEVDRKAALKAKRYPLLFAEVHSSRDSVLDAPTLGQFAESFPPKY